MKITISQEGTSPISITVPDNNKQEIKSSEGVLAGIGIAILAFFALGIISSLVQYGIDEAKFKKAYNKLTNEQKEKVKSVLKETQDCMISNTETQTKMIFDKFRAKLLQDKNEIKKLGYELNVSEINYTVNMRYTEKFNKDKVNKHQANLMLEYSSVMSNIYAEANMIDDYSYQTYEDFDTSYIEKLDKLMKAHNIDDNPDSNEITRFNVKNITNNVILKPTAQYDITDAHHISENGERYDICYHPIMNFSIDKAKAKKEIGFFLDILNKK